MWFQWLLINWYIVLRDKKQMPKFVNFSPNRWPKAKCGHKVFATRVAQQAERVSRM